MRRLIEALEMAVALEDFDSMLNERTLEALGDTITYTPHAGTAATFKALVDHGDVVRDLGFSKVVTGDCAVEVPISVIALPDSRDVARLPRTGLDYHPKEWRRDESGLNWLILLRKKPV